MTEEILKGVRFVLTASALAMMCSIALTFGVALVCKAMKWAPINVTVTINTFNNDEDE